MYIPFQACLRIDWEASKEYLPIHPRHDFQGRFMTVEHLNGGGMLTYHPRVEMTVADGKIVWKVDYRKEDHPEITQDVHWRVTTITLDEGSSNPTVTSGGETTQATFMEQPERTWAEVYRVVRQQAKLREDLLGTDKCCAISEEATPSALECAHIVSVKDEGRETLDNAILLRADLHKLYDKNLLQIDKQGEITVSPEVSNCYHELVEKKKRLPPEILSRVAFALARR